MIKTKCNGREFDNMKDKILYFDVKLKERLWGGDDLKKRYSMKHDGPIGEAWVLSGHENGQSIIQNGSFKGNSLNHLYIEHRALFGDSNHNKFPLLIKVLDAQDDLSVQVHPDDTYSLKYHKDFGKNECWYILDAKPDAQIIFGHYAKDKKDFKSFVDQNKWDNVLKHIPVKKDDFYYIPVGTVHAIGAGIQILEVQQSSDVTYRIYDYDRVDANGKTRDLHIKQALDVINYNEVSSKQSFETYKHATRLTSNQYFTVDKLNNFNTVSIKQDYTYSLIFAQNKTVSVEIDQETFDVKPGYVIMITAYASQFKLTSKGTIFVIREKPHQLKQTYQF